LKKDILLIYPPWDVKCYQLMGLPILANILKNAKMFTDIKIIDAITLNLNHKQVIDMIRVIKPTVIGISIPFTAMIKSSRKLIKMIKKEFSDIPIFAGGYHVRIRPEDVTDLGVEIPTMNISTITGPNYSMPEWDLMPVDKYDLSLYLVNGEKAFPIQSSSGCPFSCTFCCNSKLHEKVKYRPLEDVITEIEYIKENFGVSAFHFWDETFTLNHDRVSDFCIEVINRELNIRWTAQTRANMIDEFIVNRMKCAGCVRLSIGVESGNERVLKTVGKKIKLPDVNRAIRIINETGIISYAGFMIGHVEDDIESVIDTIEFADKCNPRFVGFRIAIPYPGCVFRDEAKKKGKILTNDFSKYTDDNIVYMPEGLQGYDLKKIQKVAYAWFYVQRLDRIVDLYTQNFEDIIKTIDGIPDDIFDLGIRELIEKYCKVE
jgi:radical SAM superfamily enzyme YgiQ (UPF0313 family)